MNVSPPITSGGRPLQRENLGETDQPPSETTITIRYSFIPPLP